jgi:cellulose synthase/poly-beta-1,6-N-acetylglucosamine synthase-like glycosyltransferase
MDETAAFAKSIRSRYIKVIEGKIRKGKAYCEQQIFRQFDSDYLVMLDADVTPKKRYLISHLINSFAKARNIALVGGNARPFLPKTFIEKAVYSTFLVLDKSRGFVKDGNNIYGCSGQCLAITKQFAKSITFPAKIIAEDDYIYFSCISRGLIFHYCKKAIVYYKLPKTLTDYLKQVFRADPDASIRNVQKYFGDLPAKEYHRPSILYAKAVLWSLSKNLLGGLLVINIRILSKFIGPFVSRHYSLDWFTAKSTK